VTVVKSVSTRKPKDIAPCFTRQ